MARIGNDGRIIRDRMPPPLPPPPPHQNHTGRNVLIAVIALIALIIVWPKGKKVASTTSTSVQTSQTPVYRYVTSDGLNVRQGPSPDYGVITFIYGNTQVQLLEGADTISGNWRKIRFGSYEGWVDSTYLQTAVRPSTNSSRSSSAQASDSMEIPVTDSTAFRATHRIKTNDGSNLRLRSKPSIKGTQIDSLAYGSYVQVLETGEKFVDNDGYVGNWMRIRTQDNKTGWCFGAYLTKL